MTEETNDSAQDKAIELIESLKTGKNVYDHFAKTFRESYVIAGSTIEQWESNFKVHIPDDLDPQQCKQMDAALFKLHQEATFYQAAARAVLQALKSGSESEFRNKFTALVKEYEAKDVKIAATTLNHLAKQQIADVDGALMAANVANDFWSDILEHLAFCRKLVENMVIASSVHSKLNYKG